MIVGTVLLAIAVIAREQEICSQHERCRAQTGEETDTPFTRRV
jgi:hypothetical protein